MSDLPADRGPLGWRNWRAQSTSCDEGESSIEFVFFSDAHLTEGNLELGPYEIINIVGSFGPTGNAQPGLVLRVADYLPEESAQRDWSKTDTTHYHGGGIAEEFAALLALALGIRLRAGGPIREFEGPDDRFGRIWTDGFDRPLLPPPRAQPFRAGGIPMLPGVSRTVRLTEALPFLELYPHLSLEDVMPLLRAARAYEQALWLADGEPQTSWLLLVGAVEAAAARWAHASTPEETLREAWPDLWEVFERAQPVSRQVLHETANLVRSGKRFREFLLAHLPPPPEERPEHGRVDWGEMRSHVRAIYAARSKALHEAVPLPLPMIDVPRPLSGTVPAECTGAPLASQGGVWLPREAPMHLHVFAYIAGEALRKWWRSLTAEVTSV
jgi:hypothetical protein